MFIFKIFATLFDNCNVYISIHFVPMSIRCTYFTNVEISKDLSDVKKQTYCYLVKMRLSGSLDIASEYALPKVDIV